MIANAALVTSILYLALLFFVMGQLRFLTPWRRLIFHQYWRFVALYSGLFVVNLFGLVIFLQRKVLLKDAGQKLIHFDKQIQNGEHGLSDEIVTALDTEEE